jgi:dihydropteroate synthase
MFLEDVRMSVGPISLPRPVFDWRLRSRTLRLGERTLLMAIVNLTPDSFSGDGLAVYGLAAASAKFALAAAIEAVDSGADIVDLGAESTRPGAEPLTSDEEQARLLPVLESLITARPNAIVSVDTYHAATARAAVRMGAEIINDVSGLLWDETMAHTIAQLGCGLVLMHTRGRPSDWRAQPPIPASEILPVVFSGLIERMTLAEATGIASERIIADPGFGFGKRGTENMTLLAGLRRLHELGRPLLIGLSRKGFLGDAVRSVQPEPLAPSLARRTATIAAQTAAILAGAHVLRVHEVQPAREAAAVADALLAASEQ